MFYANFNELGTGTFSVVSLCIIRHRNNYKHKQIIVVYSLYNIVYVNDKRVLHYLVVNYYS